MDRKNNFVHPYIPNTVPEVKAAMLAEIGVADMDELYAEIPEHLRFRKKMNLPRPLQSEVELKRHIEGLLDRNRSCGENLSFLGGGCWPHYVPAVCDEINRRSEFLTAYAGEPYEDHGRFQSLFEYQSLMGELLDMEVVNVPTYDWAQAAATCVRMAGRITGRREFLVADTISPERLAVMRNYCHPVMTLRMVGHDPKSGRIDRSQLESLIGPGTAGLYYENPNFLGALEDRGRALSERLHRSGALCVVGADPISLGVIMPPAGYGADIVCGDIQGLGMHMNYGGGLAGFIATRDEERFVMEYPSRLFGIARTSVEGEIGFGDVAYDRTSFGLREEGKEFVGTHSALWGITAGVYLALMGPQGMVDLGTAILQRSLYAQGLLSGIPGLRCPRFAASHFKQFTVDFNRTGRRAADINQRLREKGIFGGQDLSKDFPDLGECALYCVTEIHSRADIDRLADTLSGILKGGRA